MRKLLSFLEDWWFAIGMIAVAALAWWIDLEGFAR